MPDRRQELEEEERRAVRPMEVVDDDEERSLPRGFHEERRDRVEEMETCDTTPGAVDGRCNAGYCKNVDYKGKRSAAESGIAKKINSSGLDDLTVMELDSCSMATTRAEITECVVENGRALSAVLSDAIFPEGIGH